MVNVFREKRLALKSELQIRKKALHNDEFPSQEIIDEFMQEPIDMTPLQLGWSQPNVVKFVVRNSCYIQFEINFSILWHLMALSLFSSFRK